MRNTYKNLVVKPEGKRLLGRPRREWADNIKMDLVGEGWEGVGWMHLVQVGFSEHGNEPSASITGGNFLTE
jgi:hypothetical protein